MTSCRFTGTTLRRHTWILLRGFTELRHLPTSSKMASRTTWNMWVWVTIGFQVLPSTSSPAQSSVNREAVQSKLKGTILERITQFDLLHIWRCCCRHVACGNCSPSVTSYEAEMWDLRLLCLVFLAVRKLDESKEKTAGQISCCGWSLNTLLTQTEVSPRICWNTAGGQRCSVLLRNTVTGSAPYSFKRPTKINFDFV